ncbi:MAG: hypothetical protein KatS3mg102_0689 [Planctomycetota bacterium]|nr:MAG: hypothetical protein KatS3mg102_0689 [Planctomycetota bacterium]
MAARARVWIGRGSVAPVVPGATGRRPCRLRPLLAAGLLLSVLAGATPPAAGQQPAPHQVQLGLIFGGGRAGRLLDDGLDGGALAREVTLRRRLASALSRAGNTRVLGIDTGDTLFPDPVSRADRGRTVLAALAAGGVELLVPGARDLALGIEPLSEATRLSEAPQLLNACLLDRRSGRPLFRPWIVLQLDGLRLGVIGVTRPDLLELIPARAAERIEFLEPVAAVRRAIAEVRAAGGGAEAFIAAGDLAPEQARQLAAALPELAAVIGGADSRGSAASATVWDFAGGRPAGQPTPVLVHPRAGGAALGVLELRFARRAGGGRGSGERWQLVRALVRHLPLERELAADPVIAARVQRALAEYQRRVGTPLFPDFARAFPGGLDPQGFARVVASIVREKTGAEVCVLHRRLFDEAAIAEVARRGALRPGDLERMIRFDDDVVVLDLPGSALRALIEQHGDSLATAGLGRGPRGEVTVSGRPIAGERWYEVATSSFLAVTPPPLVPMRQARVRRDTFELDERLALRPSEALAARRVEVRELVALVLQREVFHPGAPPLARAHVLGAAALRLRRYEELAAEGRAAWVFRVENARLTFTFTQARKDDRFAAVRDKRANAADQFAFSGAGRLELIRLAPSVLTSLRADMRYTRLKVEREDSRTAEDDLRLRIDLTPVFLAFPAPLPPLELAPFGSAEFDTEFEKPEEPGAHRQKELFLTLGVRTPYPADGLETVRLGVFASYEFTDPDDDRWQGGLELELRYQHTLPGGVRLGTGVRARWFALDSERVAGDLDWFAEPYATATLPLVFDLHLVVDANAFVFKQDKVGKIGLQGSLAVGFSFSQTWKIGRDPLLPRRD